MAKSIPIAAVAGNCLQIVNEREKLNFAQWQTPQQIEWRFKWTSK